MSSSRTPSLSDVHGLAQLAIQATLGVTQVVEGVHRVVWNAVGVPGHSVPGRTRGITGFVFGSVRGVTRLVGKGADGLLAGLRRLFGPAEEARPGTPRREVIIAALNGVMGDHLADTENPLAISMALRHRGELIGRWGPPSSPEVAGKILVLIHGLCVTDLERHARHYENGADHGEILAVALGYEPVYLHYNSGLRISHNGRELSDCLERLVADWPTPVEELTVVAHSMGGLLIRSAHHHAKRNASRWVDHLRSIVFLGTPHHGAPLERAGSWVDQLLGSTPYTAPFAKLGQLRSAGITDLRYGHLLDEDESGHDRLERRPDRRQDIPLPEGVCCYAVAATLTAQRNVLADRVIGDGLVPIDSALGKHDEPRRDLRFDDESQWIAVGTGHMELLSSAEVAEQIVAWLTPT